MNEPMEDERLAERAKAHFDDSVERLDAATLSRLNQSRQRALGELRSDGAIRWGRWAPAAGAAAAAVVAVVVLQSPSVDAPPGVEANVTDFEILLGEDSLEMLEDLEFFSWIDAADMNDNVNVG